ncbi:hypothetical protein IE077_000744 [Cardiosporidium cionae]|uniref:Uncharacterized protein n=1 Tax=Cardiosporidium cionae TaxID=476202 RepID=A0ABQ7JE62_9APIC|nr:hypothetical protein IE077_000744 [Cardiosporidium cionae]|eukprot:KAF8822243.1 hypothetical protein IE077_000744 [Cardiosporidium cionae]
MPIPSLVISPCPPPSIASNEFMKAFQNEFEDICQNSLFKSRVARNFVFHAENGLNCGTISKKIEECTLWVKKIATVPCTFSDICHWMWRLCLSDHGDFRKHYLSLPECIFHVSSDSNAISLPFGVPILYTLSPLLYKLPIEWPSSTAILGFSKLPWNLPLHKPYALPGYTIIDQAASREIKNSVNFKAFDRKQMLSFNAMCEHFKHTKFAYVSFGSMHISHLGVVPRLNTLRIILEEASLGMKIDFLLHIPLDSFDDSNDLSYCGGKSEQANVQYTKTTVAVGLFDVEEFLRRSCCMAVITHSSAGAVGLFSRLNIPHIVIPRLFDQDVWSHILKTHSLAVVAKDLSVLFDDFGEIQDNMEHISHEKWNSYKLETTESCCKNSLEEVIHTFKNFVCAASDKLVEYLKDLPDSSSANSNMISSMNMEDGSLVAAYATLSLLPFIKIVPPSI